MKVVILAGGMGTRLAEETDQRPKPLVEIGGKPILWHIMRYYSSYGLNEFVIGLGAALAGGSIWALVRPGVVERRTGKRHRRACIGRDAAGAGRPRRQPAARARPW